jgi:hypothetical protein
VESCAAIVELVMHWKGFLKMVLEVFKTIRRRMRLSGLIHTIHQTFLRLSHFDNLSLTEIALIILHTVLNSPIFTGCCVFKKVDHVCLVTVLISPLDLTRIFE